MAKTGQLQRTVPIVGGFGPVVSGCCCAVVDARAKGSGLMVAGLSVLDRLAVCLSRAGIRRVVVVGGASAVLLRSEALGVGLQRMDTMPALSGPALWAQGNVLASEADLRSVIRGCGRLVSNDGRRLPLGVVENAGEDWHTELDQVHAVRAEAPAGVVTDEETARQLERDYWESLTSSTDGWVDRRFNRPLGRGISKTLVATAVTPNQVSVLAILLGLAAAGLFACGTWWTAVWGALVLQLSAVVDCVDGDLARAQCRESTWGKWLDVGGDQVVHLSLFLGLGVGQWRSGAGGPAMALGNIAGVGVIISFLVILRVLLHPELRGDGRVQRLIDATTNRDFSVLLILFALGGVLHWFLWLAAVGSHLFWMLALTLQIRDRGAGS
jgi:phosphatidylglycerophosphate synthase